MGTVWGDCCGQGNGMWHTQSGQRQHFTMPNLAHVLAPQDAQERRDAFPFHLSLSTWKIERQTDTRSNYTRTILDNGICANMDRLAPDKARARVAGVIHSVDATRRGSNKRRDQQQRIAVGGQAKADVKH